MKLQTVPPTDKRFAQVIQTADYSIYILPEETHVVDNIISVESYIVKHTRKATKRKIKQALKRWLIDGLRKFIKESKNGSPVIVDGVIA